MPTVDVQIEGRAPYVVIVEESLPSNVIVAPDTRTQKPVCTVCRGENYHGPLVEEYYITYADEDPEYVFLWECFDASQRQDDISRLDLLAWLKIEKWADVPELATQVLLYAMLQSYLLDDPEYMDDDCFEIECDE